MYSARGYFCYINKHNNLSIMNLNTYLVLSICALTTFSCTKETNVQPVAQQANETFDINNITSSEKPGAYFDEAKGTYKLVLQPGEEGQDALVQWKADDPRNANSNAGSSNEIDGFAWTVFGQKVVGRSLIKFTGLSQVPSTAKVIGAKLFLYGRNTSGPLPQGNSSYPGSPYTFYGDNSLVIQGVKTPWDESTVTWNTQPKATDKREYVTAPSTSQWNSNTFVEVTELVKPMVADNAVNNGFMLRLAVEGIYRSIIFASSEEENANKRPKLVVIYKL